MPSGPKQNNGPKDADASLDNGDIEIDIDVDESEMSADRPNSKKGPTPNSPDDQSPEKDLPEFFGLQPGEESKLAKNLASVMEDVDKAVEAEGQVVPEAPKEVGDRAEELARQKMEAMIKQAEYEREVLKVKAEQLKSVLYLDDYTGVYRQQQVGKSILFEELFQMPKGKDGIGFGGEIGPENEWGLREVQVDGKFNFLKWSNMLLVSEVVQKWFDDASDFKLVQINGNEPLPLSLVRQNDKYYFLTTDGFVMPASEQEKKLFLETEGISVSEKCETPKRTSDVSDYILGFASRAKNLSERFAVSVDEKGAINHLINDLENLGRQVKGYIAQKGEYFSPNRQKILAHIKQLLGEARIGKRIKRPLFRNLLGVTEVMRVKELFSPDLLKYKWDRRKQLDNGGWLVDFDWEGKKVFSVIDAEDNLLYKEGQFFDKCSRFYGKIAVVKQDNKFNFISKANGALLSPEKWINEVIGPHAERFRIRIGDKWNFVDFDGNLIRSDKWYEDAQDFDPKTGRALVKYDGKWMWIDKQGNEFMRVSQARQVLASHATGLRKRGLIAPGSQREALYFYKHNLNYRLHKLFRELIEKHPDQSYGLARLFGLFRKTFNEYTAHGKKKPLRISQLQNELQTHISSMEAKSLLNRNIWPALNKFIHNLRYSALIWGEVKLLSVPLSHTFKGVIDSSSPEQRVKVGRLVFQMEEVAGGGMPDTPEKRNKVFKRLEIMVTESNIDPDTTSKIRGVLSNFRHNRDVCWQRGGNDIEDAEPQQLPSEKKKTRKLKRRSKTADSYNPTPDRKFNGICQALSNWVEARHYDVNQSGFHQAMKAVKDLQQEYPAHPFEYKKFAIILSRYANYLAQYYHNPKESRKAESVALRFFEKADRQERGEPETNFWLGVLKKKKGDILRSRHVILRFFFANKYHKQAREHFERVLKADPYNKEAYRLKKETAKLIRRSRLGTVLLLVAALAGGAHLWGEKIVNHINKWIPEIEDLISGQEATPQSCESSLAGNAPDADECFKDVLRQNPSAEVQKQIVRIYFKAGRLDVLRQMVEELQKEGREKQYMVILLEIMKSRMKNNFEE